MSHSPSSPPPTQPTRKLSRPLAVATLAGLVVGAAVSTAGAQTVSVSRAGEAAFPSAAAAATDLIPIRSGTMVVRTHDPEAFRSIISSVAGSMPGVRIKRALDNDGRVFEVETPDPVAAVRLKHAIEDDPAVQHVQLDMASSDKVRLIQRQIAMIQEMVGAARGGQNPVPVALAPEGNAGGGSVDPVFNSQWHFINNTNPNRDNNIPASIYTTDGLSGAGVNIGLPNLGLNTHLDPDHLELDETFSFDLSMPFDPVLLTDSAAITAWAGLAAADQDGVGIQGVAPGSQIGVFNWPTSPNATPILEFDAFDWKNSNLGLKIYQTFGYFNFPSESYNDGGILDYVRDSYENSVRFGRGRKGVVNIFGTGMNLFAPLDGAIPIPKLPDPYNFPPANPGDSFSPVDQLGASPNQIGVTITNGWLSGPWYVSGQTTYYAPANDRRSLVFNTVAEDGQLDIYAAQGSNVFASFYAGTPNQFQGFGGANALTAVPGAGNIGFYPATGGGYVPDGTEHVTGPAIGAGVIALMLEQNPNLKIRDIQHILFESIQDSPKAPQFKWPNFDINRGYYFPYFGDPAFAPPRNFWQVNAGLYTSDTTTKQAIRHSDRYGFGMVDADLAIEKAANWSGAPPLVVLDTDYVGSFNNASIDSADEIAIDIPDATFTEPDPEPDGETGTPGSVALVAGASPATPIICVRQNIKIESVVLELAVEGLQSNDLYLELISPYGTRSIMLMPMTANLTGTSFDGAFDDDIDANGFGGIGVGGTSYALYRHEFLSWKFWGELSGGDWQFAVIDVGPDSQNPEGEEPGDPTEPMPDPGADMIITLGELGVPGSAFRSGGKTITGYRLRIFGTDTDVPIFDGCDPFATSCPGDLDGNGVINLIDLQIFIDWFLAGEAQADLDGDGDVDFNDLNLFRGIWIPGFCDRRDGFNGTDPFSGGSGGDGPSSRPI